MNADRKIGVLLLNLGGPDSLDAVRPFLFNLFSDRKIIRLGPAFMQRPLAYAISGLRYKKTQGFYRQIGGKSPIGEITYAQAKAVEEALLERSDRTFKAYVGMRYWRPFIEEAVRKMEEDGIRRVVVLNLYPQYSIATTGSSLSRLNEIITGRPIEICSVDSWHLNSLYIAALEEKIRHGLEHFHSDRPPSGQTGGEGDGVHVLFSAHSLPVKFIEEGDPYADQIRETAESVSRKIGIKWDLSYQSRSGPVKWLEPSTEEMLERLAARGIKNLLVVPVSFVSDHIETLYEIDILYRKMAASLGIRLERVESLNTAPLFISALKEIILARVKEAGWI